MISWSDTKLSLFCFLSYFYICVKINMDYIGCIPPSIVIVNMLIKYRRRSTGAYVEKYEEEELVKLRKKANNKNGGVHRPIAQVKIGIPRGKNLRSRDLGLPGNVYASASWANNVEGKGTEYEIGSTATGQMTTNPVWDTAPKVAHRRLSTAASEFSGAVEEGWEKVKQTVYKGTGKILTSSTHGKKVNKAGMLTNIAGKWDKDYVFLYPVLQPLDEDGELKGWGESRGGLVVRIYLENVFNKLMDDCLGEVVVPLKSLISNGSGGEQREVSGFFEVKDVEVGGRKERSIVGDLFGGEERKRGEREGERIGGAEEEEEEEAEMMGEEDEDLTEGRGGDGLKPEVFLRMQLTLKEEGGEVTDAEREASSTIAQELSEVMPEDTEGKEGKGGGGGVVVGAMGTVRSAMQTAKWIQNLIANIVDVVESVFNIVTWVDMHKSMLVFVAASLVWLMLIFVPTRWVVMIAVLQQFGMGLYLRVTRESRRKRRKLERRRRRRAKEAEEKEEWGNPVLNLLSTVPTGEDLRRKYFWESFRRGLVEKIAMGKKRREGRLREIWKARFSGMIKLR